MLGCSSADLPFSGRYLVTSDPGILKEIMVTVNPPKDHSYREMFPLIGAES
jgi:hypothetical protein